MLYSTLKLLIEKGRTSGLKDKLNVFFATDQITRDEYEELFALLTEGQA